MPANRLEALLTGHWPLATGHYFLFACGMAISHIRVQRGCLAARGLRRGEPFADQPGEFDDHGLGPETAFAFAAGRDEADVAAVIRSEQQDVGIAVDFRALERREGNERIVF